MRDTGATDCELRGALITELGLAAENSAMFETAAGFAVEAQLFRAVVRCLRKGGHRPAEPDDGGDSGNGDSDPDHGDGDSDGDGGRARGGQAPAARTARARTTPSSGTTRWRRSAWPSTRAGARCGVLPID